MLATIVNRLIVDLVGVNDQLVGSCHFYELLQQIVRVQRACRIIRIDDHDGPRIRRDLFQDIGNISSPAGAPVVASNYSAGPDDNDVWIPQSVQTPVGQDMPEPGTLLIWGGLALAVAYRFRKRLGA